jgi:MFS family permease
MLSALGDRLHEVALLWIATEAIGGQAGLVAAAGTAARLLVGLPGGVLADRWNRRWILLAADLLRALAVATLAVAGAWGPLSLVHLAAVAAALGALDSLFSPALQASLPALAPEPQRLQRLNALLNLNQRLALVLGPSLTGVLLAVMPIERFFAIDTATFAASACAIAALGRGHAWQPARAEPGATLVGELAGAVRLARANALLTWGLGLIAVWNVCNAVVTLVGLPLLARQLLGGGPDVYGYLLGAYGVGNVASNLVLASRPIAHRGRMLFGGALVWALGFLALAAVPGFEAAALCAAIAALGGPMGDLTLLAIIQTDFPSHQIGKIFSLRLTLSRTMSGVGLVRAAPIFAALPVRPAMGGTAVALVVVALVGLARFGRVR